ncbi:uncharacterized protein LOC144549064 [Carex rostrata]
MAPQNTNLRLEGEKCSYCKKLGHNREKCWFKHSHLRPNRRASEKGGDRDGNNRGTGASLAGPSGSGRQDQMQQLFQQFSMWYENMDDFGSMDFVYDSTDVFPIAANPLITKESKGRVAEKAGAKEAETKEKNTEAMAARQKRGPSSEASPSGTVVRLKKSRVLDSDDMPQTAVQVVEAAASLKKKKGEESEEEIEEERRKKGKDLVVPPSAVVASQAPRMYDFDEAAVVAVIAGPLPDPIPNVGYVWQAGFPPQYPNSVAMQLPGYSAMQDPSGRPEGIDPYSREMFRANQLPYMLDLMKTNPDRALEESITRVFELGSMLVHLKDDHHKRKEEFFIPQLDHKRIGILESENIWWKNAAISKCRESKQAQLEHHVLDQKIVVIEQELATRKIDVNTLERKNKELANENATLKKGQEASQKCIRGLEHEVAILQEKLDQANPAGIVRRFLASRAFTNAAVLSCEEVMKFLVYREFEKLTKIYPFTPEQIGFVRIPQEKQRPKSLRGYSWDIKSDLLVSPNGEMMMGTRKIELSSGTGTGILYPWPADGMPKDPTMPHAKKPRIPSTPRVQGVEGRSSRPSAVFPDAAPSANEEQENVAEKEGK